LYLVSLSKETGTTLTPEGLDIASSHFQQLEKLAALSNRPALERMAQILNQSVSQLTWASHPRFILEMSAVRMAHLEPLGKIEQSFAQGKPVTIAAAPAPVRVETPRPEAPRAEAPRPAAAPVIPSVSKPPSPPVPSRAAPPPEPPPMGETRSAGPTTAGGLNWQGFIDAVMKKRPLLGALLCHGEFKSEPGKKIILAFPEGSFYERQARDKKNRSDIEDQLKAFFGNDATLQLASGEAQQIQSLEKSRQDEVARIKKDSLEHPSVVQMKESLGAEVIDINVEV